METTSDKFTEHDGCMCGGGKAYHNAEKILKNFEAEMKAALGYAQAYINDESSGLEFRKRIFQRLERLQSSFKIYGSIQ